MAVRFLFNGVTSYICYRHSGAHSQRSRVISTTIVSSFYYHYRITADVDSARRTKINASSGSDP